MNYRKSSKGGKLSFKPKIYIANFGPLYKALKRAFWKKCSFVQFSTWIRAGPKRKVVLEKVEGGDWGVKVLNLLLLSIFYDLKTDKKNILLLTMIPCEIFCQAENYEFCMRRRRNIVQYRYHQRTTAPPLFLFGVSLAVKYKCRQFRLYNGAINISV